MSDVRRDLDKIRSLYMDEIARLTLQLAEKNTGLLEYQEAFELLQRQLEQCRIQRNAQIIFPELNYTIEELDEQIEKTK